ncbi:hypothetical protein BGZ96_002548 [Linnemannia gamsii]|uniref:GH16 domain-containing protein n=1 Tax=Linnemannia gamsii TaxID=64522 RepID=A0ABQ7JKM2_9FUNG|nr:hypothetical protein BGZ96_002548 [Linnemannia gamsii]
MRFAPLALLLPMGHFWVSSVDGSLFSSSSSSASTSTSTDVVAPSCGPSYSPCPVSLPCCNMNSCFPLPVCRSFKQKFKSNQADKRGQHKALIGKHAFLGDPDQAHWTTDFDHIVDDHAVVDTKHKKLVLKAKRDKVKTKSGGGFGATVSSTRWNRYGTFATQFKAGSTGPGIVTAFMLSNPALGEEISFQITGRDPKTVLTEYYKHPAAISSSPDGGKSGGVGRAGGGWIPVTVPGLHWPHLPSVLSIESITTRGRKIKDLLLHKTHDNKNDGDTVAAENSGANIEGSTIEDLKTINEHGSKDDEHHTNSLEESHTLKKSATENDLVYKIEWTPEKIEWSIDGKVLRTLRSKDLLQFKSNNNSLEIPSQPMQIQLTIWDAGHSADTRVWAGGVTDYGESDEREYVALVDWIDIACYDNKEAKRTQWPGKEASARLAQVETEERKAEEEKEAKQKTKAKKDKETQQEIDAALAAAGKDSSTKRWFPFGGGGNGSDESANVQPKSKKQLKQEEKQRKKTEKEKQKQAAQKEKEKQAREPGVLSRFSDRVIRILLRWNFIALFLVATGSFLTEPANTRKFHLASKEKLAFQ